MKAKWLPLAAGIALAAGSVAASAVDFHGYFRAGAQASFSGGDVYCAGNGKVGHKVGRLGDECDTYAELSFSQDVYNKANNKFDIHTLIMFGTKEQQDPMVDRQGGTFQNIGFGDGDAVTTDGDGINHNSGQRSSIRELWSGYTTAEGYTIWAGRRYYQRKDIHILDFYYLNNSGTGAGIENIDVGAGNLAFAVIKGQNSGFEHYNDLGETWRNLYKIDARWNAIPLGGFGTLDASVIYALPWISKYQKHTYAGNTRATRANSGALITLDHAYTLVTDPVNVMNHFIFQYGTNGFGNVGYFDNHVGEYYSPMVGTQGVRLIDWGTLDAGNFGLGYSLFWSHFDDDYISTDTWVYPRSGWEYGIVLRPEYKWTEYTRTTLEVGYSQEKSVNNDHHGWGWQKYTQKDPDLYKVTLAQQFTPGKGFWARPAIRFYASYIGGDQFCKQKAQPTHKHNYQWTFGSQVEAWW
ncbi:carbohydrate porin [Succinimonas sp.]|uniref:carbohydrate porin n=1 Tax=Succinimonas sp. TaxID=1936151 RepID=UPI00386F6081